MPPFIISLCTKEGEDLPIGLVEKIVKIGQDTFFINIAHDNDMCIVTPAKCEDHLDGLHLVMSRGIKEYDIPAMVADYLGCGDYSEYFSF